MGCNDNDDFGMFDETDLCLCSWEENGFRKGETVHVSDFDADLCSLTVVNYG